MKTKDFVKFFKTQTAAAKALGTAQSTVASWGGEPPPLRQIQIERLTNGKLKASASCYQPKRARAA